MKFLTVAGLMLAASAPALANDTSAVLTTGGLEFVANYEIVMQSEELFISQDEIRVVYQFRNDGKEDQNVLVAFPMPDIINDIYSPVSYPVGPDDNLFEFTTTFDGKPVDATLHEYAYAYGVDRTALLKELGLPLVPITEQAAEAAEKLSATDSNNLTHLGMLAVEEYDVGKGFERHYAPAWIYRATYTWDATFPAGKVVTVEHRYKPSVGGTVGIGFFSTSDAGKAEISDYAKVYCPDDALIAAVRAKTTQRDGYDFAPYTESWISYILTTGGNWGGNGIEKFRLVVDKGDRENLVSFCGEGVKKIGPTTFEMVKENFYPEKELDILILRHLSETD